MKTLFLIISVVSIFVSCGKGEETDAVDSLIGKWRVIETYYEEGTRLQLGTNQDTSYTQVNTTGNFDFKSRSTISFEYQINGRLVKETNENWTFDIQSRKNGFTNSSAYFINLKDRIYEVSFGDGTSDSHINATDAVISYSDNLDNTGPYISYQLTIKKD